MRILVGLEGFQRPGAQVGAPEEPTGLEQGEGDARASMPESAQGDLAAGGAPADPVELDGVVEQVPGQSIDE